MRESISGFGVIRTLIVVVGVAVFLMVAFWVALAVIAVAVVVLAARAIVRAVTGRGRRTAVSEETIIIEPGHRVNYDNGNVIVLPLEPASGANR